MMSGRRQRAPRWQAAALAGTLAVVPAAFRSPVGGVVAHAAQPPAAETGVRDALQRYADALESLDAKAVRKVHPSIPEETLARAFREMRELKVVIDQVRVLSSDPATVRVSCTVTQTLTPKAGSQQRTSVTRVVRLRRETSGWIIDSFER